MSLIVDINPVPWEILDLVKARILKNRAKKGKEKGKSRDKEGRQGLIDGAARRRPIQRPVGLLAKQRKDEPNFILSGDTAYIAFIRKYAYLPHDSYSIKLNGIPSGNIDFSAIENRNIFSYLIIWSNNADEQKKVIDELALTSAFLYPSGVVTGVCKVIVPVVSEPNPGDKINLEMTITKVEGLVSNITYLYGFVGELDDYRIYGNEVLTADQPVGTVLNLEVKFPGDLRPND